LEDVDENVDEFAINENQNIQKLKNPSLITSIAVNSSKHVENTKEFTTNTFTHNYSESSSVISHT
jgi:hypothetical protein